MSFERQLWRRFCRVIDLTVFPRSGQRSERRMVFPLQTTLKYSPPPLPIVTELEALQVEAGGPQAPASGSAAKPGGAPLSGSPERAFEE